MTINLKIWGYYIMNCGTKTRYSWNEIWGISDVPITRIAAAIGEGRNTGRYVRVTNLSDPSPSGRRISPTWLNTYTRWLSRYHLTLCSSPHCAVSTRHGNDTDRPTSARRSPDEPATGMFITIRLAKHNQ